MVDVGFRELATARLRIRRFSPADLEAFVAYRSDPDVARYQGWTAPYPHADAEVFFASLHGLAPGTPGTWFQFAVGLAASGELLGDVALHSLRDEPDLAELGFTFARAHQGHGYAFEACARVLAYSFETLGLRRIRAWTDVRNLRAQRLLGKSGFERRREHEGELLYERLRPEPTAAPRPY